VSISSGLKRSQDSEFGKDTRREAAEAKPYAPHNRAGAVARNRRARFV